MEIERKLLVDELPGDLGAWDAEELEQGYVAITDEAEVRVRRHGGAGGRARLTVKSAPGLRRVEEELELDPAAFERLWPLTAGRRVVKVRHSCEVGPGVVLELDVYAGPLEGLATLEVEFDDERAAGAWTPPPWAGRDVTGDPAYANQALAVHGRPPQGA
ncbi:MAG TPA: CYTH domain-containing protein [Baekduia sp.]|uniref:CYTH domain-containing protein n=1 Tax=Baekduia sp. TaxID=2600305 RepID=UPI002C5BCEA5|nr:CYTH domain-containing protein [Baekduia sp.]HMJ33616.1 CYTH domain-containing protein [Baekduia sp.]